MSVLQNLHHWVVNQKDRQFADQMTASDNADLGLSKTDLQDLLAAPRGTRGRMEAMARTYGLQSERLGDDHWREVDMARACGTCEATSQCKRWLKQGDAYGPAAEFCPNAKHYLELVVAND